MCLHVCMHACMCAYMYVASQGSIAEITNQRFSLKYQTFRQLAAAFISGVCTYVCVYVYVQYRMLELVQVHMFRLCNGQ